MCTGKFGVVNFLMGVCMVSVIEDLCLLLVLSWMSSFLSSLLPPDTFCVPGTAELSGTEAVTARYSCASAVQKPGQGCSHRSAGLQEWPGQVCGPRVPAQVTFPLTVKFHLPLFLPRTHTYVSGISLPSSAFSH